MTHPAVVLVGMPGVGKSSVGRRLGVRLGLAFRDSDDLVVAATGRSVTDLFAESESTFRAAETAAVVAALSDFDGVLALGGGSLLSTTVRDALAASSAPVVLLRAALATLGARVGDARTRPLLAADPAARLATLAAEREPVYLAAADVTVETDGRSVDDVAGLVLDATIGATTPDPQPAQEATP